MLNAANKETKSKKGKGKRRSSKKRKGFFGKIFGFVTNKLILSLITLLIGFGFPYGVETLNDWGLNVGPFHFSAFEYHDFDRIAENYIYPNNTTAIFVVGNKLDKDLIPHLDIEVSPVEREIEIKCITQGKNESCDKGFALPPRGQGLVTLELDIRIDNPKGNNYKFCLKTVDGRRSSNYLKRCKTLNLIKGNKEN